jgi:glycosyltransferase involved in cell wall biosynthesis
MQSLSVDNNLNIGFDAKRLFNNFTGLGNYSRTLVQGLQEFFPENNYYLFTPEISDKKELLPFIGSNNYSIIKPGGGLKSAWRTFGCTKEIKKLKLDIYHGLSHELPVGIKKTGVKSIVTIHDLIYKTYPNDFKFFDRKIYDFKFRYACENADKIIAVSKSTKADIIKFYNIPEDKIDVVYQSCQPNFKIKLSADETDNIIKKYNLPDEFLLYVGSVIERKNLLNIVKAVNLIKDTVKIPMVVVGSGKDYLRKVKKYVSDNNLESRVIFTSEISFFDLPAIYQKASLFIYPSQYEGFGIPLIESLWSKTPVITSNISSLPEAAGGGAFYCNPEDEKTIADGILKILFDSEYNKQLINAGFEHVQQFENKNNVYKLMEVYKSILSK